MTKYTKMPKIIRKIILQDEKIERIYFKYFF